MTGKLTCLALLPILAMIPLATAPAQDLAVHVSATGDDANDGTAERPLRTIERGLALTRAAGVKPRSLVLTGTFELTQPITLGKADDGLTIRAQSYARLLGGRVVTGFAPLTDRWMLRRLPDEARGKVVVADLRAQGITDLGRHKPVGMKRRGTAALELFVDGRPQTLARYPNNGWLTLGEFPDGRHGATFTAEIDTAEIDTGRLERWSREAEPWLYGYWFHGWADSFLPVNKIDPASQTFTLGERHHYGMRKGQRFFARNLLCELDAPGEYFVDRTSGKLYLWPADGPPREAIVSLLEQPLLRIEKASNLKIEDLILEGGRGSGIAIIDSTTAIIARCRVRNLGEYGVEISGGRECIVYHSEIHATGAGGVTVEGGDRKSLTPATHRVTLNHIHHVSQLRRTYTAAISLRGVGHEAIYNRVHHAPHQAISFTGNDHTIVQNEIHHVVLETDDAGAIYTCPRDFTSRGTRIVGNYIHHCGPHHAPQAPKLGHDAVGIRHAPVHRHGTSLIYLDDLAGGMTVQGNILEDAHRALLIGGGRDNTIRGNLILGGNIGIWIDARGLGWAKKNAEQGGSYRLREKFAAMKGDRPPFVTRYPGLKTVLENDPAAPVGTMATGNIILGAKHWKKTDGRSDPFVRFEKNHHTPRPDLPPDATPKQLLEAVDPAVRAKIGFGSIPFERIGPPRKPRPAAGR